MSLHFLYIRGVGDPMTNAWTRCSWENNSDYTSNDTQGLSFTPTRMPQPKGVGPSRTQLCVDGEAIYFNTGDVKLI